MLAANQGTRYVQISFGSWDMHQNIYSAAANSLASMGRQLDDGVSALLADLKASGQLDSTLVVMMGEFGRTVGKITPAGGRDHYPQQSVIFAGAGVKGGAPSARLTDRLSNSSIPAGTGRATSSRISKSHHSAMASTDEVRYDDPFARLRVRSVFRPDPTDLSTSCGAVSPQAARCYKQAKNCLRRFRLPDRSFLRH